VELFEQAIEGMGQFQRISFEQQAETILSTVEEKINESIDEVVNEVINLKEQVNILALPPPTPTSPSNTPPPITNM
jgi:hypothetical protein